jgi:choline monooxygenase
MSLRDLALAFDPSDPIERAWTPPAGWYYDAELYELEHRAVFHRSWQLACRVDEVKEPGQWRAGCFAREPWVVVRQEDGSVRAFSNVCRHKGREVVTDAGEGPLVCGYHGWKYGADGGLKSAPKMAGVQDFDKSAMSLPELRCETWGPWVFVNLDDGADDLADELAPLTEALDASGWGELKYYSSTSWDIACNWKVYADNYLDGGYHIPHMHPSLDAQLDMESYGTELFNRFNIQSSGRGEGNQGGRIGDGAIYAWLYPNLALNRYGSCLDSNYIVPVGPDRCRVVYEFFFHPDVPDAEIAASVEQSAVTQREDIEICESVQRGVVSARYHRGRYAPKLELGEHHFHGLLAADYRRALG